MSLQFGTSSIQQKCLLAVALLLHQIAAGHGAEAASSEFPSSSTDVKRCHYGDTNCLRTVVQSIFVHHAGRGISALRLRPLDPLDVGTIGISSMGGGGGSISLNLTLSDTILHGWKALQVRRVVGFGKDPRHTKFRLDVFVPVEQLLGQYSVAGQMLVVPLSGHGSSNITFENVYMNITLRTTVVERNGEDYVHVTGAHIVSRITKMHMQFGNLLNDPALSGAVNEMLNDNQQLLIDEMRSSVSQAFEQPLAELLDPVFAAYPYRQLFVE